MHATRRRIPPWLTLGIALGTVLTVALAMALPPDAAAQSPAPGNPWASWRGCWRLIVEAGAVSPGSEQPLVCITEVAGGARLTTTVGGRQAVDQIIRTDGSEQTIDEAGCRGTQRAEWSRAGARLYSSASLTCSGDPAPRRVSGYGLLLQDSTWLDIQAVELDGRDTVRVRRYRHVDSGTSPAPIAGRTFDLDDVKEAGSRVSPAALEAAVVESRARLALSGKTLLQLDAAGVPGRVIDLIVAISYPDKFIIERSARADRGMAPPQYNEPFMRGMFGLPMWASLYGFYDSYWGPYYYSPFAYSYYGRFDPRYVSGSTYYVAGGFPGSGNVAPQPTGTGRAVDGRGYTQVRPRDVQSDRAPQRPGSTNIAASGAASAPTATSSSAAAAPASGSASSAGYSSGSSSSSSSDSGRTAVPR